MEAFPGAQPRFDFGGGGLKKKLKYFCSKNDTTQTYHMPEFGAETQLDDFRNFSAKAAFFTPFRSHFLHF